MLTQLVIDWWCGGIAFILGNLPVPPAVFTDATTWVASAGSWFSSHMSPLGVIVPWGAITNILGWWGGVVLFWLATIPLGMLLRFVQVAR